MDPFSLFALGLLWQVYFNRWSPALALLAIIFGPLMVLNALKAMRSGEGAYDADSSSYMGLMNYLTIALGLAMAVWGVYFLSRLLSALF